MHEFKKQPINQKQHWGSTRKGCPRMDGEETWLFSLWKKNIKIQSTSPYNYFGGPKNHHSLAAKYDLLIL